MEIAKSRLAGAPQPKSFTVRFESHSKGQVIMLDRIESDGRFTSSSTILYLDGTAREFQDFDCSGTQSSRRLDGQTLEIRRACGNGDWTWIVRQPVSQPKVLIIDITGKPRNRSGVKWRVIFEKQETAER